MADIYPRDPSRRERGVRGVYSHSYLYLAHKRKESGASRFLRTFIFARRRRIPGRKNGGAAGEGRGRRATRKSIQHEKFSFSAGAEWCGHRNVVLPVHAVASRGFEIPGIKLGLKPGKCEFEMLPPDVRARTGSAFGIILCLGRVTLCEFREKLKETFRGR